MPINCAFCLHIFVLCLVSLCLYYVNFRLSKSKTASIAAMLSQMLMRSICLPMAVLVFIQIVFAHQDLFIPYFGSEISYYIVKFHKISYAWLAWWCVVRFNRQLSSVSNTDLLCKSINNRLIIHFFSKSISTIGYTVMALLIVRAFDINVFKLLTVVGAPAVVIAYASQNVIKNLVSGVSILFNGPFKVNDLIHIPDKNINGYVRYIGFRTTQIQTLDKKILCVPNSVFDNVSIINDSRSDFQLISLEVLLDHNDYKMLPDVINDITVMLDHCNGLNKELRPLVCCGAINADSALVLTIKCFAETIVTSEVMIIKQYILMKVMDIITKWGCHVYVSGELTMVQKVSGSCSDR